ncbi:C4-dicarboxylate TRAP transporter substrate-binding protein [Catenovulum sp. 2E275]|uniref:C4-dicarboxylate TRAP transporter substrate-binding protein n=1 Tax=Catenovulum sp. 2E275 TaxID=2980497 RepID=UPI0021CFC8A6|nr:C4-dicarboxylate TRAP transporter substrate-binding protein [Catenovulum sp. 2E275]MCU4677703.1 C4-dicarboxylate TRAP transporter substrate-binding protein [Catenovulum sp. 2E275]
MLKISKLLISLVYLTGLICSQAYANSQLNVVTSLSQSDPMYLGLVKFKQLVENKSGGELKIRIFIGSQLGNDNDILEQAMAGAHVAVLVDGGRLSFYQDEMGILGAPYLLDNINQLETLVNSPMFAAWSAALAKQSGIKILAFNWWQGERHILANKIVKKPADLSGIRLRTIGAPVWIETIKAMGATPTPLSWAEVYSGLQQKVIDGAEAQHAGTYGARLYEVISYINKTGHINLISGLVASNQWFEKLTIAQQNIVINAAQQAGLFATSLVKQKEAEIEQTLTEQGVEIIELDKTPFKVATSVVYKNLGYQDLHQQIQTYLDQHTQASDGGLHVE